MKSAWLSLLAGICTAAPALARDFRPLRPAGETTTFYPASGTRIGNAVLVHGIFENGGNFRLIRKRLQARGFDCLVPRLRPADGRGGLDRLAQGLMHDIDACFGTQQDIHLIGFSMGGVVGRYYLQKLGGAARCRSFVTIASPHRGTHTAWFYPSAGAAQMRPGSAFLADLEACDARLGDLPVTSYRTPLDLVILPACNSVWPRAENVCLPVLLHPLMLQDPRLIRDLERRLVEQATR